MKILDNDPLDLSGQDGEVITVMVVRSKATVDLVLNGKDFNGSKFTLDKAKADPFLLAVGGIYTDKKKGGGAFSVSLSGSGVTATKPVTQFSAAEARRSFVFAIDVI